MPSSKRCGAPLRISLEESEEGDDDEAEPADSPRFCCRLSSSLLMLLGAALYLLPEASAAANRRAAALPRGSSGAAEAPGGAGAAAAAPAYAGAARSASNASSPSLLPFRASPPRGAALTPPRHSPPPVPRAASTPPAPLHPSPSPPPSSPKPSLPPSPSMRTPPPPSAPNASALRLSTAAPLLSSPPPTPASPPQEPTAQLPAEGTVCMQAFRATGVHAQNEGDHGVSDPQLWLYETQGGTLFGKSTIVYDDLNPVWPPQETFCVDRSRTARGRFCVDIRDDWPQPLPPLLHFKCVPLPSTAGAHTVALDKGCELSFVAVLPPPPAAPPPPPFDLHGKLNAPKCAAMLRDRTHIFRKMWNVDPWWYLHAGQPTCFERKRDDNTQGQHADSYFDDVKSGAHCDSNWFEGSPGNLGLVGVPPKFTAQAPALLGFDESIEWFCTKEHMFFNNGFYGNDHAGNCANSNNNILALWGNRLQYNLCRNLEWQVCAAKGLLPGQQGFGMRFSHRPGDLNVFDGGTGKMLGDCRGWRPEYVGKACGTDAYSTDDIYFLEVCMFSFICRNGADVFKLNVDDFYVCDFDGEKFDELARLLKEPPNS
ncbi:hypothetical protein AB1Y20_011775 [Prymnesium parvum]|uniref:C2 domain-containing protein n=1 Tax=Prymnesium parvum TaxID=97485 RepID=A0AB34IJG2_PRYPA